MPAGHRSLALLAFLCLGPASVAEAHEVRPAYLELTETEENVFDALWKVPARGDLRLGIYLQLPDSCETIVEPSAYIIDSTHLERWRFRGPPEGLGDAEITITGLRSTMTDVLVRIQWRSGRATTERLSPAQPTFTVVADPGRWQLAGAYTVLGVEHILLGIDYLLFVLGLLLIVRGVRPLVKTITAFTVAHSITLAIAALGFVHIPSAPVEAVVALSIVYLATEIIHARQGRPGLVQRRPWLVAFTFGLLHGLGFAGALSDIGLPAGDVPLALLTFNVGVEAGQLIFVAAILVLAAVLKRLRAPTRLEPVPAYAIGTLAMCWFLERSLGLFPGGGSDRRGARSRPCPPDSALAPRRAGDYPAPGPRDLMIQNAWAGRTGSVSGNATGAAAGCVAAPAFLSLRSCLCVPVRWHWSRATRSFRRARTAPLERTHPLKHSLLLAPVFLLAVLLTTASTAHAQPFERILSDVLDERPNCIEHTTDSGYIIAGTQKDLPQA